MQVQGKFSGLKEKKVVFLRMCLMPKTLEFFHLSESIPSHLSASFLYCHRQPSLQAWLVEVRLIHFRIEVVEGNLGGACSVLKFYVLEQPLLRPPHVRECWVPTLPLLETYCPYMAALA